MAVPDIQERVWVVELQPHGPWLVCRMCPAPQTLSRTSPRAQALEHLASHARRQTLDPHLRTCQCRQRGCRWHLRRRGCQGPIRLVLSRHRGGLHWRLADVCVDCAGAMDQAAVVPESLIATTSANTIRPGASKQRAGTPMPGKVVKEMLTYLGSTLPPFAPPAARLLALQCGLRSNQEGRVHLPGGLLRAMRLGGHAVPWHELEDAGWLRTAPLQRRVRCTGVRATLLDPTVLAQAVGRGERARAADWALRPEPLRVPRSSPPAIQLVSLALCTHSERGEGEVAAEQLSRLTGMTVRLLEDVLERLVL